MKGSNIRRADLGDAENIRQLYQASIRGLGPSYYPPEQIERWVDRPVEAFQQDIQKTLVLVCECEDRIVGCAQIDVQAASVLAVYVHPDYARRKVGSLLLCFLECEASSADLPQLTAKVPLSAVEFFRAHDHTEVGPCTMLLPDGSGLPGVAMEQQLFQKIEFVDDQLLADRVLTSLRCDHAPSRMRALQRLKEESPQEVLDIIVALLRHPEEAIRRRAGGGLTMYAMLHGEPVNVEQKADELAAYLQQGEDARVRLSCAIVLMSVHVPAVDRAYLHALRDAEEKIVRLACLEVGDRGGLDSAAALFCMLNHPQWHVRLEACKALITQKTADHRVVSTLEAMGQEPEAAVYDAQCDDNAEMLKSMMEAFGHGDKMDQCWGKLDTILAKARQVVDERSAP